MLFKKQLRRYFGPKIFEIVVLLSLCISAYLWLKVFVRAGRINNGWPEVVPLSDTIGHALMYSGLFILSLYYSIDTKTNRKKGFMEEERIKVDIDQRIIDAHVSLKEIREGVSENVVKSSKFDDYGKKLILTKTKIIYERCLKRLKRAEKIREDAYHMPAHLVKSKLIALQDFLIKNVSMGINQLGEILAKIHELNMEKNLGTQDIERLGNELDEELRIAEMVDKTMVEWEYGKDAENT